MKESEYFIKVKELIYPSFYSKEVFTSDTEFLLRDGNYVFYCLPAGNVDYSDTNNTAIKKRVRGRIFALPVLLERGLFVHAYGSHDLWRDRAKLLKVDKTALRPIILQNINFIDPSSGELFNNRTAWGIIKFGFCGKVIDAIEALGEQIRQGANKRMESSS